MPEGQRLGTLCVHAGELEDAHGSPHTPVYTTTTFAFPSTAAILDVVEGRKAGALYTRYGLNPSIQALEVKLAALEGAEAALAFASGMAAEAAAFLTHGRAGIVCIGDAYGGTLELIGQQLPLLGISTHFLLGDEVERLDGLLAQGPRLVFLETPSNPTMEIFDIAALAARAHAQGALLVVDNTFASPVNQQPIALGADPVAAEVVDAMAPYLRGHFGNPSSDHPYGRQAREAVAQARAQVAALIGAQPGEILFTGCATEANNLAILGAARALRGRGWHVIASAVEHPSVAGPMAHLREQGWEVRVLDVDGYGRVSPAALAAALRDDT